MNKTLIPLVCLTVAVILPAALQAADTYSATLQAGDERAAAKEFDAAITGYENASRQAANETEKSLAIAKKASVFVSKEDYVVAKAAAEDALSIKDARAVAKVTALQALASCQMKGEKDFEGATKTLGEAAELTGVEWALPTTKLMLGDAQRMSGEFDSSIATYQEVVGIPDAPAGSKAVAWLNIGLAQQYGLNNGDKAKEAYAKAVELNPGLKAEVDTHLAKIQ